MKITIVGSGAMGCYFACMLSKSQLNQVSLISRNRKHVREIREAGIRLIQRDGTEEIFDVNIDFAPNITEKMDVVLILVKSYDSEIAVRCASHLIGPHTFVGTFQNGLGNVEMIANCMDPSQVFCGSWAHSVMCLDINHVHYSAGRGPLRLAKYTLDRMNEFAAVVNRIKESGLKVEVRDNWREVIWNKVLMNSGANALSAITHMNCGALVANPYLREIMKLAVRETAQVAMTSGISVQHSGFPEQPLFQALAAMDKNEPTMLQDLKWGRRSEIDSLNLAVVREGQKVGISTPVNQVLGLLLKFFEEASARGPMGKEAQRVSEIDTQHTVGYQ